MKHTDYDTDYDEELELSEIGYDFKNNNNGHLQISKEGWVICKITGKPIRYPIAS